MTTERRLFVEVVPDVGGSATLDASAARHAAVLRLRAGDALTLFDGRGVEARAEVSAEAPLTCVVLERSVSAAGPRVVLVQAVPKAAKLDEIVRAVTEIGVAAIHLAHAERSIARLDASRAAGKIERLARVAREAARQSEQRVVPSVAPPASLAEVAARAPSAARRIVLSAREGSRWSEGLDGEEAWVAVGPEGGFSEREEEALLAVGWSRARLDVGVMRVETAAPVICAMVLDHLRARRA